MRISLRAETLWDVFEMAQRMFPYSKELANFKHSGGIPYGTTWSQSFKLERLNGKFTAKRLHLVIERTDIGQYRFHWEVRGYDNHTL